GKAPAIRAIRARTAEGLVVRISWPAGAGTQGCRVDPLRAAEASAPAGPEYRALGPGEMGASHIRTPARRCAASAEPAWLAAAVARRRAARPVDRAGAEAKPAEGAPHGEAVSRGLPTPPRRPGPPQPRARARRLSPSAHHAPPPPHALR